MPAAALVDAPNITATSAGASGRTRAGGLPLSPLPPPAFGCHGGVLAGGPWSAADAAAAAAAADPCPPTHGTVPWPGGPRGGPPGLGGRPPPGPGRPVGGPAEFPLAFPLPLQFPLADDESP